MTPRLARLAAAPAPGALLAWAPAALLLVGAALAGPLLGPPIRIVFVGACGLVGWMAWQLGPAAHMRTALALFAFTPLVRRVVDLELGYDAIGLMLTGPLLAIAASIGDLARTPLPGRFGGSTLPMSLLVTAACAAYAATLSFTGGDLTNAAAGALKWGAPLVYAAALHRRARAGARGLVPAAAATFAVILPLIGLYGLFQYVDPPAWDRLWLQYAPITSAGLPKPFAVRTFSTLNSPASFATFTAAGLMLVGFLRPGWQSMLLGAPALLSLLLSSYRTAWLSLAAGIWFCLLFRSTRGRAAAILIGGAVVIAGVGTLTPFGQQIGERLATFERVADDDSGRERLQQFATLWNQPSTSRALFGTGFTAASDGAGSQMAVDGMIIGCWLTMGLVVGILCLLGLISGAVHAVWAAMRYPAAANVVVGALGCGALVQLPLANIASGELGFLFWTFAALAVVARGSARDGPPARSGFGAA